MPDVVGRGSRFTHEVHRIAPWLALAVATAIVSLTLSPGSVLAADGKVKLALTAVGQAGSYFDLTIRPGGTRMLEVEIGNDGVAALGARTYAADVYTIVNGGFGGRLRDEATTGTTRWIEYATAVVNLDAGERTRLPFTVSVPAKTGPGEYIASIILENELPIRGDGVVALDQFVRQAVAVVITVPGERSPGLAIGAATHEVVGGRSVVSVAVENSGNVRLKPIITFSLTDAAGAQVSQASVPMDTFYARTSTFIEVPHEALLLPGAYTVALSLVDLAEGARADASAIALVVEAPAAASKGVGDGASGLTDVTQSGPGGSIGLGLPLFVLAGAILLILLVGVVLVVLRRRRPTPAAD